jgi:hypothetical protein
MKLIIFLLIAFLISCIFTLKQREQKAIEIIKDKNEIILLKDSLILEIQESNRLYIDAALNNK